jgi:[1-hydroxy-2-(trimethylamino)ethyl]phosphonate dioxygenase
MRRSCYGWFAGNRLVEPFLNVADSPRVEDFPVSLPCSDPTPASAVDPIRRIVEAFSRFGDRHYGENVTELQHALQSAHLARHAHEPDAIVLSCLLHDVGHLIHDLGEDVAQQGIDACHERIGADWLAEWYPEQIVEPIRQHVASKRYLCLREAGYRQGLSEASEISLQLQGGPMTEAEARQFESSPHCAACLTVRRYDDQAKVVGMQTDPLESYLPLMRRWLRA